LAVLGSGSCVSIDLFVMLRNEIDFTEEKKLVSPGRLLNTNANDLNQVVSGVLEKNCFVTTRFLCR